MRNVKSDKTKKYHVTLSEPACGKQGRSVTHCLNSKLLSSFDSAQDDKERLTSIYL